MPDVKCSVANCSYWVKGNQCGADAIMIEIDKHSKVDFKAEFAGEQFDSGHQDYAQNGKNTCCHTFKPKKG